MLVNLPFKVRFPLAGLVFEKELKAGPSLGAV